MLKFKIMALEWVCRRWPRVLDIKAVHRLFNQLCCQYTALQWERRQSKWTTSTTVKDATILGTPGIPTGNPRCAPTANRINGKR
jgi:hypothetical protein